MPSINITHKGNSLEANASHEATILQAKPLAADSTVSANPHIPSISASAVLGESDCMPEGSQECKGHDFNASNALDTIMESLATTGFQATNVGLAIDQIKQMRSWRLSDVEWKEGDDDELKDPAVRNKIRARIFLAYTSNQISSGQREVIKFLVQHKMVDVIISTAGGIEEDLVKCFQPTYLGDFKLSGRELRKKGINRIGNLLVPNKNYCDFEDWIAPIFDKMHDEQEDRAAKWAEEFLEWRKTNDLSSPPEKFFWTPSSMIHRLGNEISHESSVLYWAAKNGIPIFSPALTDGSIGDMLYFHSYKRPGFVLDIAQDIRLVNDKAVKSHATGMIILGGGLVKHHCCNANLMRNGADFSVYVNTGQEFDGSDSGASPDEAISWGKIRITAKPVKVCADATFVFPLLVSQTFAKDVEEWKKGTKGTVCHVDELDATDD